MSVLKNCYAPQQNETNCHARLSHKIELPQNIRVMVLVSFVSLVKRYSSQGRQQKPTMTDCSKQEERRRDKTPVHIINNQTVTDGISRRVTTD